MEASTYTRIQTTLKLVKDEEFVAYSDGNNYPFFVNQITYTGGEWVELSGPAMTKKGRGFVSRTAARKLNVLASARPDFADAILKSHDAAINELAESVK